MATGIYSWSQTAGTNSAADSTIAWPEGQLPGTVNDSARAMMAVISKWRDDLAGVLPSNGTIVSGGSINAQTITTNGSIAALTNGWTVTFRAGFSNTGACTLAVDGLAAKQIQLNAGANLTGGEIAAGSTYTVRYSQPADAWLTTSAAFSIAPPVPSGTLMLFQQTAAPSGWTKQTTHNDKALRVVSGTASSGGTLSFSSQFVMYSTGNTSITQANLPSVNFTVSGTAAGQTISVPWRQDTFTTVVSGATPFWHGDGTSSATVAATSISGSAASGGSGSGHAHAIDLRLQYVDIIIASKN